MVGAGQRPRDRLDVSEDGRELTLHQVCLCLDVEAGEQERHGVAEPAEQVEADLRGCRRRTPSNTTDPDAVGCFLLELDGAEVGHDVRVEVARRPYLLE